MLALLAAATLIGMLAVCRSLVWRRPDLRAAIVLLAVGSSLLAFATTLTSVSTRTSTAQLIASLALIALTLAAGTAAVRKIRITRAIDQWLDFALISGAGAYCGWHLLLDRIDSRDHALYALSLTAIVAIGAIAVLIVCTRRRAAFAIAVPAAAAPIIVSLGLYRHGEASLAGWFELALLGCVSLTVVASRIWVEQGRSWGLSERYRNALVVDSAFLLLAIITTASVTRDDSVRVTDFVWVALCTLLFAARCIRAYLVIVTLEASVSTRNAMIRLPAQAIAIRSEDDFRALLVQLAEASAALLGLSRAEIRLEERARICPQCALIPAGLTADEFTLLSHHPPIEASFAGRAEDNFAPYVLSLNNTVLPVAAHHAWSRAAKVDALLIPLHAGERLLGRLELWSPGQRIATSASVMSRAADLGGEAGALIDHARLFMATHSEIVEAEMLLAVSEVFSRATNLAGCLPEVARTLLARGESSRVTITLIDHSRNQVYIAADARNGAPPEIHLEGEHFPMGDWVSYAELVHGGADLAVSRSDPFAPVRIVELLDRFGAESYLAIPGYTGDRMTSIVQVMSPSMVLADSAQIRKTWAVIARQIQLGIESVRALDSSRRNERIETMRRRVNEAVHAVTRPGDGYRALVDVFRVVPGVDGAAFVTLRPRDGNHVIEAEWAASPIIGAKSGQASDLTPILTDLASADDSRTWWVDQPDLSDALRFWLTRHRIGALAALPVRQDNVLPGALLLYSVTSRPFDTDLLDFAGQLAPTLAQTVKSMQIKAAADGAREEQIVKLRMLQAATSREDPIEALNAAVEAGLGYAGAESINVAFIDPELGVMVIGADCTISDWPGIDEPGTTHPIKPGSIQERGYLTQQTLMYSSEDADLSESELSDIAEYGVNSWIAAPLRVGGKVVGLLQVLSRSPIAFDQRRLRFWDEVAQQIAPVITTLQVSFDNRRLSRQQALVALINQAGATVPSGADTYAHLARIGLELPDVESSILVLWHEEDGLLEIAHEAIADESLRRYHSGQRIDAFGWAEPGAEIFPRDPIHFFRDDPDLTELQAAYLDRTGLGRAAFFMLLEEQHVRGVLAIGARSGSPFRDETIQMGTLAASSAAAVVRNVLSREEERHKEREQHALFIISQAATTCTTVNELLSVISDAFRHLCTADCAEIYAFSEDGLSKSLRSISHDKSWPVANPVGSIWPTEGWAIDQVLRESMDPIIVLDRSDPRINESMAANLAANSIESLAFLPLGNGAIGTGYIALFARDPRRFISSVMRSTSTIAAQATLAIEHIYTRVAEERVAAQRALLVRVGKEAGSSLDIATVLNKIARASLGVADSESCVIELFDAETSEMVIYGISRVRDWVIGDDLLRHRRPFGSWSIDEQLRVEGSVVIGSVDDERVQGMMRSDMLQYQTNSILAHAFMVGGAYAGNYYLFARQLDAYRESDLWISAEISTHIVSAVQNARLLEGEHLIARERERLLQIAEAATRTLDLRTVLQDIAVATLGLAGAESCHIELLDTSQLVLITEAYAAIPEWEAIGGSPIGHRSPVGDWEIDRQSVEVNEPISIGSIDDPRVIGKLRDDMVAYGTQSILLIPIWLNDVCAGLLNIYSRKRDAFSNAQQLIAHTLTTYAANAIQNAQTHSREQSRRQAQEALLRLNSAATATLDVYAAMREVCVALCEVVGAESAAVGLYLPDLDGFEIIADVTDPGWDYADAPGKFYATSQYAAYDRVLASREAFVIDRKSRTGSLQPYIEGDTAGLETYALVPLWFNDVCLGYMGIFDRRPGRFDDNTLELLSNAAPLIALALSNGLTVKEQQRRAADRAALVNIGRAAITDAPVSGKFAMIARACLDLSQVEAITIYEWSPQLHQLTCLAVAGEDDSWSASEDGCQISVPVDSVFRPFLDSAEPSTFTVDDSELHPALQETMRNANARMAAIVPLRVDDESLGAIAFFSRQARPFDLKTLLSAREVATQTALTIRASRLLDTTRRYASEQSALLAANRAVMIATQTSINDVLETISRETMPLIGAECCEIEGIVPDLTATVILAQILVPDWRSNPSGIGTVLPLSDWPITQRVLEDQVPLILDCDDLAISVSERQSFFGDGTQTALVAPMAINDRSIGTITYYSRNRNAFTNDDARLATQFGSLAALAIDRVRTHTALEEQATIDGLTGLLNYRGFIERLDHQIAVANRSEDFVSLLMIDLDNFKSVNDRYGHLAGDAVLREMGKFLKNTVRASDLVARYGGDEFVVIMPGTDATEAQALRKRLAKLARSNEIRIADGTILIPLFSIGLAAYPSQATDRRALIEMADRSMYEAKHTDSGAGEPELVEDTDPAPVRLAG